jgi:sporulation protein YlmC with PRC-barrel domain
MNKQEKQYTVDRINQIMSSKGPSCECKPPSLKEHIRRAVLKGELQFKPIAEVQEVMSKEITGSGKRWGSINNIDIEDVFEQPSSFKVAKMQYDESVALNKEAQIQWERKFNAIIDRVWLNEFQNGKQAIAEASEITF